MSMFRKPSSGGGLSQAQLDQLVSDPELGDALLGLHSRLNALQASGVTSAQLTAVRQAVIAATDAKTDEAVTVLGEASLGLSQDLYRYFHTIFPGVAVRQSHFIAELQAGKSFEEALQSTLMQYGPALASTTDIASVQTALVADASASKAELLAAISAIPAATYPGKVDLVNRASGQADVGYTRAGGIGVPEVFFNTIRTLLVPYTPGSTSISAGSIALNGYRTVLGDKTYCLSSLFHRVYDGSTVSWATLPNHPDSSLSPTVLGTVNGKLLALGGASGSSVTAAVYTFDPATSAWSARAAQPAALNHRGVADLRDGRAVLFGGKNTNSATAATATNIVANVDVYNEPTNTWSSLPALPVRMSQIRTVVRPDKSVVLFPANTADIAGTALNTAGVSVYLWSEAGGTVALDAVPSAVGVAPGVLVCRADGKVLYVASGASGKAGVLDPSAPAGSQWTVSDWDNLGYSFRTLATGCQYQANSSGFQLTSALIDGSSNALTQTYVGANFLSWSQSFYQVKN